MSKAVEIYIGPDACPKCLGSKRIANDDDQASWKHWAELPPPANLAVQLGIVYPIECPVCSGTGWQRPTVVCLCGSTRFYDVFQRANYEETMAGKIVLSVGFYPHSTEQAHGETIGITPEQKQVLDELHMRKIDLADEVLILNVGGYIGESTARELAYARFLGKVVRFLEVIDDL
jgi:hypothetical protein